MDTKCTLGCADRASAIDTLAQHIMILCIMILNKFLMVMVVSGLIILDPTSSQVDCQLLI